MASTYSTSLKIQEIGNGEQAGVWGNTTNTNWQLIEQAVAGVQTITMANANYTLTNLNGVLDEARNMVLVIQGTNSAIYQVIAPLNQPKMYVISNQTTGGYAITIGASSGSVVSIPNGTTAQVYTDGTNFFSAQTGSAGDFKVNGNFTVTGNQTDTGNLTVGGTFTANNAATFAVSPTAPTPTAGDNTTKVATTAFVTSAIPTFGTMATQNANAVAITGGTMNGVVITGGTISSLSSALPVASGGTGVTTSTGSGSVVLGTSPTISGAVLTSIASSVITNGSLQSPTSGTTVSLSTSIPSWARRITVIFNGVTQDSTSPLILQIGAGSYITTGYISLCSVVGTSVGTTAPTNGFGVNFPTAASETLFGSVTLCLQTANTWVESGVTMRQSAGTYATYQSAGVLALSGALDRIQLTTVGGSANFTGGNINIQYQ
jgi:hypothetical protein